jgi:nitroreductase
MELFDAINARRSVRQFVNEPVPRENLDRIVAAGLEAPTGCNMQLRHFVVIDDAAIIDQLRPMSRALDGAPAVIVIVMEPKAAPFGEFWVQDASAAMENMLLAATALGYGSCWVEGAIRAEEDKLREILGVPAALRVWSLMPVGKSHSAPQRPDKAAFADVVHYNGWG